MDWQNAHRCEASLGWVDRPRCENTARIEIDGRKYCHLHASLYVSTKTKSEKPNAARCECTCKNTHYLKREKLLREAEGWRCKLRATVLVDGVNMCASHAKLILLQHAVKDGLAKVLPHCGPYRPMCTF